MEEKFLLVFTHTYLRNEMSETQKKINQPAGYVFT